MSTSLDTCNSVAALESADLGIGSCGRFRERWRLVAIALFTFLSVGLPSGCRKESGGTGGQQSPSSTAFIKADPNPVPKGKGGGKTVLTWDTLNGAEGEVYVSRDQLPEKRVAPPASSGTKEIDWIYKQSTYEFRLYAGRAHKEVLASVTVTREK